MIKIAALDDDMDWLKVEKEITEDFFQRKEKYIFNEYKSVETFLFDLEDEEFDIYLLDMELPETNGLNLARMIKQKQFDAMIIYITNYVEYAVEAFEVNAFRYIPKNMLKEKLPEAYETICKNVEQIEVSYLLIQNNFRMSKIREDYIYYLTKKKKYVYIKHKYGESKVRATLDEAYKKLNKDDFVKIDKSYVVNLKHVMSLDKRQVTLRDGTLLDVSQPQLAKVKERISEYWRNS